MYVGISLSYLATRLFYTIYLRTLYFRRARSQQAACPFIGSTRRAAARRASQFKHKKLNLAEPSSARRGRRAAFVPFVLFVRPAKPSTAHFTSFGARILVYNWHPIEAIFCSKYPVVKGDVTELL